MEPFENFKRHATLPLKDSRHTWTARERLYTIDTIWHSEPAVREHYASHVTEMPNFLALVPNVPWTRVDEVEIRSHYERPVEPVPRYGMRRPGGTAAAITARSAAIFAAVQQHRGTAAAIAASSAAILAAVQQHGGTAAAIAGITAPIVAPVIPAGAAGAPGANDEDNDGGNDGGNDEGNDEGNDGDDDGSNNSQSQDSSPYGHWPPLSQSRDPDDIPDVRIVNGIASTDYKRSFLDGESLKPEEEGNWQGAKFLAAGSYGAVGLWCKTDGNGNVIDRMAVKDNSAVSRSDWRDPKNWRDRLPREIAVGCRIESRRAEEPEACQYINRQRGYRLLMSERRFRLYADFASGGDLCNAVMPYHQRWNGIDGERVDSEAHIPEAFIWYIMKALATAILFLQQGTIQGDEAVADWKQIMHLDMQPANILLDLQTKKRKSPDDEATDQAIAGPSKRQNTGEVKWILVKSIAYTNAFQELEVVPKLADFGFSFFDLDFGNNPELDENPSDHILRPDIEDGRTRYAPVCTSLYPLCSMLMIHRSTIIMILKILDLTRRPTFGA